MILSEYWSSFFPERNVKALAIYSNIVNPSHYTGEPSHVSDTEVSQILENVEKFEMSEEPFSSDLLIESVRLHQNGLDRCEL